MFALFLVRAQSFDLQCSLCKTVADMAAEMIANKIDDDQIKNTLITKCRSFMPGILKGLCDEVVTMPLNELIEAIRAEETPTRACCAIKMCKKVRRNARNSVRAVPNGPQFQDETKPTWSVTWEEQI